MKKLFVLATLLTIAGAASAGFNDNADGRRGGFNDGAGGITTVAQALKARDDAKVALSGVIVGRHGNDDDEFTFRDRTGEIVIEVDDKAWNGLEVRPNEPITIYGEVDQETFRKAKIDVKRVTKD